MALTNPGPIQQKPTTAPVQTQPTAAQQINTAMQNASAQQPTPAPVAASTTPTAPVQTQTKAPVGQNVKAAAPKIVGNAVQDVYNRVSQQNQQQAQTTQEALGGTYFVGSNGSGQKGLKAGDQVVTSGGTYMITSVNPDGSYQTRLANKDQTLENYTGSYNNHSGNIYRTVPGTDNAPKGLKVGDQVVTSAGTYTINGVMPDGSYKSFLSNPAQTLENYTGQFATAPGAVPQQPQTPDYARKYDPNVNYTTEINKAIAAGDFVAAAALEMLRREKIKGEGLEDQYALTDTFAHLYDQVTPEMLVRYQNGYVANTGARTQNPYPGMEETARQIYENQQQQATNRINYTTEQAIREQERIREDAEPEFQRQRNQVDIDEARAKSNSALYAEARGDRGGIGQSQYNEIQAAAMQNRQAINTAQQKLATDIARKVADLRAQGEYQLSDELMELGNQYLSQLMSLKAQGAEFALTVEQMNRDIADKERQFQLQVANITGDYNGQPTYAAQKYEQERAAGWVEALAKAGQPISPELLKAAGLDQFGGDISKLANAYALSFSSGGSGGGGGSGRGSGGGGGGNGSGSEPAAPSAGPSGNENKPTFQNYMNNIAGKVSAIDRNKNLTAKQKAEQKLALVGRINGWVNNNDLTEAEAGRIIEAYDLRGDKAKAAAAQAAYKQSKRSVDKEGKGLE